MLVRRREVLSCTRSVRKTVIITSRSFSSNEDSNKPSGPGRDVRRAAENSERPFPSVLQQVDWKHTPAMTDDGKPSKEFIEFFTKLASEVKKTDITARQQMLNSPKTQDFRALVAKRKNEMGKGVRYTSDELKQLFKDMTGGRFPDQDQEKWKRMATKYELLE